MLFAAAVPPVILAVLLLYGFFDPEKSILFPKCIFHAITGLKCPGCGTQRAIHQLLHGNFAAAMHCNALAVLSVPYIALGIFLGTRNISNPFLASVKRHLYSGNAVYVALSVIAAFWILRNIIPGM